MIRTEDYKRELYSIFFAQKWVIFWTTVIIFIGAVLVAYFWPPTYSATGSILVKGKHVTKSPELLEGEEIRYFPLTKEDLASEVEILTSPDVVGKVVEKLRKSGTYQRRGREEEFFMQDKIYAIKDNLKTEVVPASNVIGVSFFNSEAGNAVRVLDTLMKEYIDYRMEFYYPSQAEVFFARQASGFYDGVKFKTQELMDLVAATNVSDPQKEIDNNILIKKDMEQQLNLLKNDYLAAKQDLEHLRKAIDAGDVKYFSFIDNRAINDLSVRLVDLLVERGRMVRKYLPSSENVKAIDENIKEIYSVLRSEVTSQAERRSNQVKTLEEQISRLEKKLVEIDTRNVELKQQQIDSQRISQEIAMLQSSYETFFKRREEAKIQNALETADLSAYVTILNEAFPSNGPVFPQKRTVIPLGLIVGLIAGVSLGFIKEFLDHTFKRPSDVYKYADLPVIFSISRARGIKRI